MKRREYCGDVEPIIKVEDWGDTRRIGGLTEEGRCSWCTFTHGFPNMRTCDSISRKYIRLTVLEEHDRHNEGM